MFTAYPNPGTILFSIFLVSSEGWIVAAIFGCQRSNFKLWKRLIKGTAYKLSRQTSASDLEMKSTDRISRSAISDKYDDGTKSDQ